MALYMCLFLYSCGPEETPGKNVYKIHYASTNSASYVCCYDVGTDCNKVEWSVMPILLAPYAGRGDVRGFFINENWQQYWPELAERPDLVDQIIAQNPKAVFAGNDAIILLKDSTLPVSEANTLFGFFNRGAEEPCAGYPGSRN